MSDSNRSAPCVSRRHGVTSFSITNQESFGVVRNPYERVASEFCYQMQFARFYRKDVAWTDDIDAMHGKISQRDRDNDECRARKNSSCTVSFDEEDQVRDTCDLFYKWFMPQLEESAAAVMRRFKYPDEQPPAPQNWYTKMMCHLLPQVS